MTDWQELPDLACEDVGGAAIACNDEFFAAQENLLRARAAEWREHDYTDRGKWMDGWETRRRRDGGDRDWCVVRLGMPGKIRGVVVDTAYFRGNFPESCAISACEIDDALDLRAIDHAAWIEILPRSALRGDAKNAFAIAHDRRVTHVRLDIFPDGGVARLRVHGEVAPRWELQGGLVDLAALDNGAVVTSCSDMFFGNRANLIKPGPSRSMADGWETRRRRSIDSGGNDWAIVKLAARGTIERLEIDTSHFKGNAPGRCTVECGERLLLATPLQPHARHVFVDELRRIGAVDELKLSVYPDGGVARLRAWGARAIERPLALDKIDRDGLLRCCGSRAWGDLVAAQRPYEDVAALLRIAERAWWALAAEDHLEAFAAHPKIGEQSAAAWSRVEQAGASIVEVNTRHQLGELNARYAERHGFIFITCATGRTIDDMLAELRARLDNSRDVELRVAAEEQAKITRLRLRKLIGELS
jgi:allantoicase